MRSIMLIHCIFICGAYALHEGRSFYQKNCQIVKPLMNVIDAVAKGIVLRHSCIVFIVDRYYHTILDLHWIKSFSTVSTYMVVVEEDDDVSCRADSLSQMLAASKKMDCNAYIILNKNASQLYDILHYGEKEYLINTRGDFVLLESDEIFNSTRSNIWNRIVNVVFIRRYNFDEPCSEGKASMQWFDLSTVPFPFSEDANFEPLYIDSWYGGRFRFKNELFPDKTRDLKKHMLRVALFEHIPAVTENAILHHSTIVDNSQPLGIEFEIVKILAEVMNFRPAYYVPPNLDALKWGTLAENGSYSGLFAEAISGQTAFLLGDLYYTLQHLMLFDLSTPYNTECLTFLTPESLYDNSWKILMMPFKMDMWISVLLTLFLGGFIFYMFARCYERMISVSMKSTIHVKSGKLVPNDMKSEKTVNSLQIFAEFQNSILYTYGMLVGVSLPRLPGAWSVRVFIGWWWLYSILVTVAYRASMTAILANPLSRVTIDTVSELAKSNIAVGGWSDEVREFFLSSLDTDSRKIGYKLQIVANDDEAISRVGTGAFAYYENKYFLRNARAKKQISAKAYDRNASRNEKPLSANRNLHIMSECIINMPISIGLDKNSPLKKRVDIVIQRIVEAGLVQKWLSDTMQWVTNIENPQENAPAKSLINLRKLYGALITLAVGYFFSFIAFGGETLHWKYVVQRHPLYDKYYLDRYYSQFK